jgi:hypothetical protein
MLDALPAVQDRWFDAVATPAALLIGLSKSGLAGFGALATPMMAITGSKLMWDGLK